MDVSSLPVGTKKMGRPPIVISELLIDPIVLSEQLASMWCTNEDIALCLGVSLSTVKKAKNMQADFATALKRGNEDAKGSLQRRAKRMVDEGNVVMTIFALKNKCGWSDRREVKHEGDQGAVTVVNELGPAVTAKPRTVPAVQDTPSPERVQEQGII